MIDSFVTPQVAGTEVYQRAVKRGAMFDARAFVLPKEEVCNYFIWRQQDATRNSIMSVGQANFPHSELQNKHCGQIQDMLLKEKNINWNDFTIPQKRGVCCNKTPDGCWRIDQDIPIFTQDRNYIDKWVYPSFEDIENE